MSVEQTGIIGHATFELFDESGDLIESCEVHNIVTQVGDQMYGERGATITSPPAAPTGMKLGSGATSGANAPSKTGTGAALTTYLTGSSKAFDSTYPQSALNGAARRITYKRTYAAGEATTASPITEAVIVNSMIATDATAAEANTIARLPITGISSKAAGATLVATWHHDLGPVVGT